MFKVTLNKFFHGCSSDNIKISNLYESEDQCMRSGNNLSSYKCRTDPVDSEIVFSAMTEVYNQKQLTSFQFLTIYY
jgi:hypothetical protein